MAPSVIVPNAMAQPRSRVAAEGGTSRRRRFGPAGPAGGVPVPGSVSRPGRAAASRSSNRAPATAKWAGTDAVSVVAPEVSRAAASRPALNVACSWDMAVRSWAFSSAAPWAFIATLRQPTATPSAHTARRAEG